MLTCMKQYCHTESSYRRKAYIYSMHVPTTIQKIECSVHNLWGMNIAVSKYLIVHICKLESSSHASHQFYSSQMRTHCVAVIYVMRLYAVNQLKMFLFYLILINLILSGIGNYFYRIMMLISTTWLV